MYVIEQWVSILTCDENFLGILFNIIWVLEEGALVQKEEWRITCRSTSCIDYFPTILLTLSLHYWSLEVLHH
jgi:hypothetical protein